MAENRRAGEQREARTTAFHERGNLAVAVALAIPMLLTLLWVGITTRNGLNYHVFPTVIAASPAALVNAISSTAPSRLRSTALMALGISFVLSGWLLLQLLASVPTATFVSGQPGGTAGEAAVLTLVGAILGRRLFLDRRAQDG